MEPTRPGLVSYLEIFRYGNNEHDASRVNEIS